jgi:cation:H+ antiporter
MEAILWLVVMATGLMVAAVAGRWSVGHLTEFAAGTRIPPFVIGITLVSIGTDLPEIANSVVASLAGHGDINIWDSIGSAVQATLILGLLPIVAGSFPMLRGPGIAVLLLVQLKRHNRPPGQLSLGSFSSRTS